MILFWHWKRAALEWRQQAFKTWFSCMRESFGIREANIKIVAYIKTLWFSVLIAGRREDSHSYIVGICKEL